MVYTVHRILQARILEWVACPSSRGSSQPRDRTQVSRIAGRFFISWATREAPIYIYMTLKWKCYSLSRVQLFVTPWTVCSPPGSSVHRLLQTRILKWIAIPFSGWSSWPRDQIPVSHIAGRFPTFWVTRCVYTHTRTHTLMYLSIYLLMNPFRWPPCLGYYN